MAIRDDFEIVASQVRVALQRFALVVLVIAAFGAMLIGKADTVLVENARVLALDIASPALEAIARPVAVANRAIADLKEFASLREDNARLRESRTRMSGCAISLASRMARRRPSSPPASSATASAPMCAAHCSMSGTRSASARVRPW